MSGGFPIQWDDGSKDRVYRHLLVYDPDVGRNYILLAPGERVRSLKNGEDSIIRNDTFSLLRVYVNPETGEFVDPFEEEVL